MPSKPFITRASTPVSPSSFVHNVQGMYKSLVRLCDVWCSVFQLFPPQAFNRNFSTASVACLTGKAFIIMLFVEWYEWPLLAQKHALPRSIACVCRWPLTALVFCNVEASLSNTHCSYIYSIFFALTSNSSSYV